MTPNLDLVRSHRNDIHRIAARFGAHHIRVFGSVARGASRADSDLDILVDFEPGRSLLDQAGFEMALEELLGCKVDVVAEGGISPYLEKQILAEAVAL